MIYFLDNKDMKKKKVRMSSSMKFMLTGYYEGSDNGFARNKRKIPREAGEKRRSSWGETREEPGRNQGRNFLQTCCFMF